jgi:SAM-dependent methyltransferase
VPSRTPLSRRFPVPAPVRKSVVPLARQALRGARRLVRPGHATAPPPVPADVADREALATWLADTDVFGPEGAVDAEAYVACSVDRIQLTVALLPDLPPGARVLELGANPYLLTRVLMRRGLDVRGANWFSPAHPPVGSQVVRHPAEGTATTYEFDHFDAEVDRFPYPDGSFDLVLCCEILEHLPNDPTHLVVEAHRVLAPGGHLVLTTPNAVRADRLAAVLAGDGLHDRLSGHGTHGRHNREYTHDELADLLVGCGFTVDLVVDHDIGVASPRVPRLPGLRRSGRAFNLFAVARADRPRRWYYPDWLYSSGQARLRAVEPDAVMGRNDDLQTWGFHGLDATEQGAGRWTAAGDAVVLLQAPDGPAQLVVELTAPPDGAAAPTLTADGDGACAAWEVTPGAGRLRVAAPWPGPAGPRRVVLRTDRTFVPADLGLGPDGRALGVLVHRVALEPGGSPDPR